MSKNLLLIMVILATWFFVVRGDKISGGTGRRFRNDYEFHRDSDGNATFSGGKFGGGGGRSG